MTGTYDPVDLELIEYVRDQNELDKVNEVGVVIPNTVLLNGRQLRIPADHPITVDSIDVPAEDLAKVTLTLFVRKVNIEARVKPDAE